MEIAQASASAMRVRELYGALETLRFGRPWGVSELMLGFSGDVGDLAKLVSAATGNREYAGDLEEALGHELADCLWSVLVLADHFGIDLETAFAKTMDQLEITVTAQLAADPQSSHTS